VGSSTSIDSTIGRFGRLQKYPAGALLFQAGDESEAFYRIESGTVRISRTDEHGRGLEIARLGEGDFLGEAVALAGSPYPFSAEAVTDIVVLRFEGKDVRRAIAAKSPAALFFVELLARKCVLLSGRVESLGLRTVRQRLAQYLLQGCAGGTSGLCVVGLQVKKGELARQLGTVGETLSRTLKAMAGDGLIEVRGREIRILDCPRLRSEIGA
jgi:CRP-like cAMP-binding protein